MLSCISGIDRDIALAYTVPLDGSMHCPDDLGCNGGYHKRIWLDCSETFALAPTLQDCTQMDVL